MVEIRDRISVLVSPQHIDMLTKIIEAYDGLGVVATECAASGKVVIHATSDTVSDLEDILANLPFPLNIF